MPTVSTTARILPYGGTHDVAAINLSCFRIIIIRIPVLKAVRPDAHYFYKPDKQGESHRYANEERLLLFVGNSLSS
jgi:hypothetical protein